MYMYMYLHHSTKNWPIPLISCSAPSAPQNLTGTSMTSQSISLSWSPPLLSNGVIQEYRVNVTEVETGRVFIEVVMHTTTSVTVQPLHPYYIYRCHVSAYTVEVGPYAVVIIRTREDGK